MNAPALQPALPSGAVAPALRDTVYRVSKDETTPHGLSMTQISRSIGLARIVLIIGLVFLHYDNFPNSRAVPFEGLDTEEHSFATWLNSAILFFFFSTVPLLSMVSGWLFFSFMPEQAWHSIFRRTRRRFISLYMPLVVWNAAYLLMFYAAFRWNPNASVFSHMSRLGIDLSHAGWKEYMNAVFGVTGEPFALQFWFVRDLFVTTLVTPVFWMLIRYAPWLGAALMGMIWLSDWNMFIFFRPDVPFFFYMGALIHQKKLPMVIPLRPTLILFALYVGLAALRALAPYVVDFSNHMYPEWLQVATRLMRICGVLGCWGLIYRWSETKTGEALSRVGGLAFFLHSAHWPLLGIIKVIVWRFIPDESDAWMLAHDLISVSVTVAIGLALGLGLARAAPGIFALMNGGRHLAQGS